MPPVGFEPTISAGERPQTYALDRLITIVKVNQSHYRPGHALSDSRSLRLPDFKAIGT